MEAWQQKVQDLLGIRFGDTALLMRAFTDRSFTENERLDETNARLEPLGDGVLALCVQRAFYFKFSATAVDEKSHWADMLLSNQVAAEVVLRLGVFSYLRTRLVTAEDSRRASIKVKSAAALIKALIGALYLDQGFDAAEAFVARCILSPLSPENIESTLHPQRRLSALTQERWGIEPLYEGLGMTREKGTVRHAFGVYIKGELLGKGEGETPQTACRNAANRTLARLVASTLSQQEKRRKQRPR